MDDSSKSPFIFRVFGSMLLVDHARESELFARLYAAGIAPKCLAETEEYRIEEYLPGRSMRREELSEHVLESANRIWNFHSSLVPPSDPPQPFLVTAIETWGQIFKAKSEKHRATQTPER
jgi:hypothetical protein